MDTQKQLSQIFGNPRPERKSLDDIFGMSKVPETMRPTGSFSLEERGFEPITRDMPSPLEQDDRGILRRGFDALTSGVRGFGESIGASIAAPGVQRNIDEITQQYTEQGDQIISAIQDARQRGDDRALTNLTRTLEQHIERGKELPQVADIIPAVEKNARQVLGEAVETGVMALTGGVFSGALRTAAGRQAPNLVRQGAVTGGLIGGASSAQQEDAGAADIAVGTGIGAGLGAGSALAVRGVGAGVSKISSMRQARLERSQELKTLLSDPNTPISQRLAQRTGGQPLDQVVANDPLIREATKQGIDGADAFIARHADDASKGQMRKMVDIAKKAFQNPAARDRSTDVVGESFMQRVNHITNQKSQVGRQLDQTARGLQGQRVELGDTLNALSEDLARAGIRVGDDGALVFRGSDFEGITGAQKAITQIWNRANQLDDAYSAHQLKRFIDNQVDFGKTTTGLTGQAERILKSFRRNIDSSLDSTFTDYANINTQYARLADVTDEMSRLVGRNITDGGEAAQMRAGTVFRRILSNSPNRGDLLKLIDNVDDVTRTTGGQVNDDLVSLVAFADALEDTFGTQAATSLQGQFRRGVTQKVVGEAVGSSFNLQGIRTAIGSTVEAARGINHTNRVRALEQLLSQ